MKKIILLLLVLTGCSSPEIVGQYREEYIITKFDPPKHVYVDLQRVSDKVEFERVFVSKHFNGWAEIKPLGKKIHVTRKRMKWGETTYDDFIGLEQAIRDCE
jgi:hypothetical protein